MIKLMRESVQKHPWLLKSIMGILAVAFVITMGWWGFSGNTSNVIASVGPLTITRNEYARAYENAYRFYKANAHGELQEETLKQLVLEGLIENKLWALVAEEMGLTVSAEELRQDILHREAFQRNGKFDPDLYRRVLTATRLTPALFESQRTLELLKNKAMMVVQDSVALTPAEIAEAQSLMARQPAGANSGKVTSDAAKERILQDLLFQKQQRALMAYNESIKASVPVKIRHELL